MQAKVNKVKGASSSRTKALGGRVRAPGDKSISHRALILGALARGTTRITGLLEGDDILHTAEAMQGFGADVSRDIIDQEPVWTVTGANWKSPEHEIDFGNAGTGARLIMGAAAGFPLKANYTGDASLSSRPMGRVLTPLRKMGATFKSDDDKLPITQKKGGKLKAINFTPPHASAQVKSALLLAGLNAEGTTEIIESRPTRDHTENMFEAFGVPVKRKTSSMGNHISIEGPAALTATPVNVPGDPSSAAFLIAAALIVPGSDIIIENVMMNPARTGLFEVLTRMGAFIRNDNFRRSGGETIADIHVKHSKLTGVDVPASQVPSMVDEYPILAVCAAYAHGRTDMRGLGELRVKESDRLAGTFDLLKANGVIVEMQEDSLHVTGGDVEGGGIVATHHDHRLAMSALILGLGAEKPVRIDDASMIATSFPSFFDLMAEIGAKIKVAK
ncbi:MAG: 3-phosphoshikimate 1-carboxyvinyltransferase [Hyphomonadaceae bacterium]|nr:3-phosphoshikimate 1-carboxyvinyltransferase [Hyphomonadaceae bacterium]